MGGATDIVLKVIPSNVAAPFVKAHHYSGKVVNNSCLHFGAFLDGKLHGVMSYGPSTDKRRLLGLVEGTGWNNFLELNRMAFDEHLPRNSESHCIAKSLRLIKQHAPQVKWIVSFADGCSCGDGTIYRASNFILTSIKENGSLLQLPTGEKIHQLTLTSQPDLKRPELGGRSLSEVCGGSVSIAKYAEITGAKYLKGFMLRYVYFLDKKWRKRLTVPELPYSAIDEAGAGMYKGQQISREERHAAGVELKKQRAANAPRQQNNSAHSASLRLCVKNKTTTK